MRDAKPKSARNGRENRLSPKQEAAALALAAGCTEDAAARESGAGARTIRTWLATVPAFGKRIGELRAEMTTRALGRLVDQMTSAADTLGYLCRKGKSEQVRLGAARAVLELAVRVREAVELRDELLKLKEDLDNLKNTRRNPR